MNLLKNKQEWKQWKKYVSEAAIPREFPCYAYATVLSYGYEEDQANYLYADDLARMSAALTQTASMHGAEGTEG